MTRAPVRPRSRLAGAAALAVFAAVILRAAWVSDDAHLTFRTIDNLIHGFGLRWNVAERVQAFTHPLWLLLVTPFAWLTGDVYFTSIGVSIAITLVMLWRLLRVWPLDTTLAPVRRWRSCCRARSSITRRPVSRIRSRTRSCCCSTPSIWGRGASHGSRPSRHC